MVYELDMWLTSGKNIVSMVQNHCRLKLSSFGQLTFETTLFFSIVWGFIMKWDGMFTLLVLFINMSVKNLLLLISGMSVWLSFKKMSSIKFSFICSVWKLKSTYFVILLNQRFLIHISSHKFAYVHRLIAYCQQYRDYDSFLSTELGPNPWITDDTALWEAASTMWVLDIDTLFHLN